MSVIGRTDDTATCVGANPKCGGVKSKGINIAMIVDIARGDGLAVILLAGGARLMPECFSIFYSYHSPLGSPEHVPPTWQLETRTDRFHHFHLPLRPRRDCQVVASVCTAQHGDKCDTQYYQLVAWITTKYTQNS